MAKQKIIILGSTGSIGVSTLRVVRSFPDSFEVYGLACRENIKLLKIQIDEFAPSMVAVESAEVLVSDEYRELRKKYPRIQFMEGRAGLIELASQQCDILLSAVVGASGLQPGLAAIGKARRIALANKETLVVAGDIFMNALKESGTELIPVDSEHSALFMLIRHMGSADIDKLILTASGGSLRTMPIDDLDIVTPEMALAHPTWSMGSKVTIDSATLMNKGLEVIEAHHLFGVDYSMIDVIIHPESIIHSMVQTIDGALYAHMGVTDMVFPILNALMYPGKVPNDFGKLDLASLGRLSFIQCNRQRYPALDLCYEAGKAGGSLPAVLNAANEIAVDAFLKGTLPFPAIVEIVRRTMDAHLHIVKPSLDELLEADAQARATAQNLIYGENR
jgi:1-deoxy-D-xylulose-5-phosphate reductoisomerase